MRLIRGLIRFGGSSRNLLDETHDEIGVANHGNFREWVKNTGGGCYPSLTGYSAEAGEFRHHSVSFTPRARKAM